MPGLTLGTIQHTHRRIPRKMLTIAFLVFDAQIEKQYRGTREIFSGKTNHILKMEVVLTK